MGVAAPTRECTTVVLQKIDCSASGFLSWSGVKSTASAEAIPSSSIRIASGPVATLRRLLANPGAFLK